jgi:hypothetical protein
VFLVSPSFTRASRRYSSWPSIVSAASRRRRRARP